MGVAIGAGLASSHEEIYGKNVVRWKGSVAKTAEPLARLIGKLVTVR